MKLLSKKKNGACPGGILSGAGRAHMSLRVGAGAAGCFGRPGRLQRCWAVDGQQPSGKTKVLYDSAIKKLLDEVGLSLLDAANKSEWPFFFWRAVSLITPRGEDPF